MKLSIEERQKLLARRLREEREKRHISQIDLALNADLSQNSVALIENEKRIPNITTIFKIADALDVSPVIFFDTPSEAKEQARAQIISLLNQYMT